MIHSKPSKLTQALIYATISCERFAWYLMLSGLVLALVERGLDKATATPARRGLGHAPARSWR